MTRQGFRKGGRILQELRMVTERAVHEHWTGAEVGHALDKQIDRLLEKRRWMLARDGGDGW